MAVYSAALRKKTRNFDPARLRRLRLLNFEVPVRLDEIDQLEILENIESLGFYGGLESPECITRFSAQSHERLKELAISGWTGASLNCLASFKVLEKLYLSTRVLAAV